MPESNNKLERVYIGGYDPISFFENSEAFGFGYATKEDLRMTKGDVKKTLKGLAGLVKRVIVAQKR